MPITKEQERELEEYRAQAFERLRKREYRTRPRDEDVLLISTIGHQHLVAMPIMGQIYRDLATYLLYDSLAMWLDPRAGLAAYVPEAMLAIGACYFGREKDG